MPAGVLVDTSAWIDALRKEGNPDVRRAVHTLTADGRAVLCDMVRLELWNGAHGAAESRMLRELERELVCVPMSPGVWATAVEMARACRSKGITIPATDIAIAACAQHHDLGLLHHDAHFDRIAAALGRQPGRN